MNTMKCFIELFFVYIFGKIQNKNRLFIQYTAKIETLNKNNQILVINMNWNKRWNEREYKKKTILFIFFRTEIERKNRIQNN